MKNLLAVSFAWLAVVCFIAGGFVLRTWVGLLALSFFFVGLSECLKPTKKK